MRGRSDIDLARHRHYIDIGVIPDVHSDPRTIARHLTTSILRWLEDEVSTDQQLTFRPHIGTQQGERIQTR